MDTIEYEARPTQIKKRKSHINCYASASQGEKKHGLQQSTKKHADNLHNWAKILKNGRRSEGEREGAHN